MAGDELSDDPEPHSVAALTFSAGSELEQVLENCGIYAAGLVFNDNIDGVCAAFHGDGDARASSCSGVACVTDEVEEDLPGFDGEGVDGAVAGALDG
jgi:hypothetical protein